MVCVVTGAGGHLGTNLVRSLLEQGRDVRVVDVREPCDLVDIGAQYACADVRDADAMRAAVEGAETVFHLAAVISVAGSLGGLVEDVNVHGVEVVARAALAAGCRRLVHCSSVHAFDLFAERGRIVDEQSPRAVDPRLPAYDRSKAAGEARLRAVVDAGLDAVIVNPTGVIGPQDPRPSRMGHFFLALAAGRLPATVAGGFDWVDVRDVTAAMIAAEYRGRTGENYLVGGHLLGTRELAVVACAVAGTSSPPVDVPLWFARLWAPAATLATRRFDLPLLYTSDTLNALASRPHVDCAKAARELGHRARPIEDTITDLYASWRAEGLLAPA